MAEQDVEGIVKRQTPISATKDRPLWRIEIAYVPK